MLNEILDSFIKTITQLEDFTGEQARVVGKEKEEVKILEDSIRKRDTDIAKASSIKKKLAKLIG